MKFFREVYAQPVNTEEIENILEILSKDITKEFPNRSTNQINKDLNNIIDNDLRTPASIRWSGQYFQAFLQKVNGSNIIGAKQYQQLITKFSNLSPKERINFMVELRDAINSQSKAKINFCIARQLENLPASGKISLDLEPKPPKSPTAKPQSPPVTNVVPAAQSSTQFAQVLDTLVSTSEIEQDMRNLLVKAKAFATKAGSSTWSLTEDGKLTADIGNSQYKIDVKDRNQIVQVLERIMREQGSSGVKRAYWIVRTEMAKKEIKAMETLEGLKISKFKAMISDFPIMKEIFENNNQDMDLTLKEIKVRLVTDKSMQNEWKTFIDKHGLGFFAHFNPKNLKQFGIMKCLALAAAGGSGYALIQVYDFLAHVAKESRDMAVMGGNIAGAKQIKVSPEPTIGQIHKGAPTIDIQSGLKPGDSLLSGRTHNYQQNIQNLPPVTKENLSKFPPNIANWFADKLAKH